MGLRRPVRRWEIASGGRCGLRELALGFELPAQVRLERGRARVAALRQMP
ncbi:MAG: hypothetical protein JO306_15520 [Gemmatimonadetes bacterium]|nr:hypothetical protein [Gemmatimonadota bacterium]